MSNKRIAVITPGGDAPGMNPCIRAVVRNGIYYGYEIYGVHRGYSGLLENHIDRLTLRSVSGIVHRGGTILESARCKEIKTNQGMNRAINVLKKHKIEYCVIIGGDGSIRAGQKMVSKGIKIIGIPASIDNDIYGTEETIGFDTAIDTAIDAVDKIRDTAKSFQRIFIVEVMGREHGFLALAIGVASGAEFILVPEIKLNIDKLSRELKAQKKHGKTSTIIIFAEGAGNPYELAKKITKKTSLEVRVSSLGYIQRGGAPSARSRILGAEFGAHAVELIRKGAKNRVVVLKKGQVSDIPLKQVISGEKKIDLSVYHLIKRLAI